jgi:Ca-activated chloride channel family protein
VRVTLSRSKQEANASINKKVMSRIVELEAVERNRKAMKLRDAGKIEEAKKAYNQTAAYLKNKAITLASDKLAQKAAQAEEYAKNIKRKWKVYRKKLRRDGYYSGAKMKW